ncbi:Flp pilus assembly protein TadG [Saccharopolyspora lacisalsi]|uniref:Flp pilus assembly protein TadG n=1 Tax=Halosaccharopolyspora lacisalsi TaxID=1000566 RepID=A0A839DYH1_9PSEU|nr:TadE/TadG family type IV pilus assembly protein [Halosaccharopolyspora lacisalsi]MBA8823808.1 Flp pilus assembly protein TadG [Halosaccharopolyspora lacisalsi]
MRLLRRMVRDERGSSATELTLLAPALIALMLFVVLCGRIAEAQLHVDDAAHQAVRAATLARNSTHARAQARETATTALRQAGVTCQHLTVETHLDGFRPGSTATVSLACEVGLADLTALGVPGTTTATAEATSVIDQWRGIAGGSSR